MSDNDNTMPPERGAGVVEEAGASKARREYEG